MEYVKVFFKSVLKFLNYEFTIFNEYTISFMDILIAELIVALASYFIWSLVERGN